MRTILFIHHAKGIGGAPISLIKMILALNPEEYRPVVLLLKDSEVSRLLSEAGIEFIIAPQKFYRKYYQYFSHGDPGHRWYNIFILCIVSLSWLLSRFYYSGKVLKGIECDIIHLNSSVLTDFLHASHKKAKTIIHFRETMADGYFGLRRSFFRNQVNKYADHIIAISQNNASKLDLPLKTTVVYNFIDPVAEGSGAYNISNRNKVLYVGGSLSIKGFFPLVDALDFLDEEVRIYFCGYIQDEKGYRGYRRFLPTNRRLLKVVRKMRSHSKAIEIGMTMNIPELIKGTAIMVSPFSVDHFSRPVIEAFAHKKPAIGSNVPGMYELIEHNLNGLIVRKNDPISLANAINYLCSNPELAKKMGENGYEKARKLFSPENIKQVEKIYDDLIREIQ